MKNFYKTLSVVALTLTAAAANAASSNVGMLIGYESSDNSNNQESTAAKWFEQTYKDGVLITPTTLDKIDASKLDALWVNIDRLAIGKGVGNLPAEFGNPEVIAALKKYVAEGGNLFLSKHATQLITELGRVPSDFAPGIFGDADGGAGTDVWCVNAYLGSMQLAATDRDDSQIYDRRNHPIYAGLEEYEANYKEGIAMFPHPSFPLLGTGDGSAMHREDHNCMWDLNAYTWSAEGKNTLEQMEAQFGCKVIGTWGHVQDYCVAGIVDFEPTASVKGRIVANGLAAYEWAPRSGVNAYHNNITKMTENTLDYLASFGTTAVGTIATEVVDTPAAYYTLQGVRVAQPEAGLYIVVKDGRAQKVIVK